MFAANEGVPSYYQTYSGPNANQASYGRYADRGYTKYVGQSGTKRVVGSRSYSYQVPRPQMPSTYGTMTPNGIAMPIEAEPKTNIYAGYSRRFADFEFETGVNSILEWDDMIWNEITVGARHNFSWRQFPTTNIPRMMCCNSKSEMVTATRLITRRNCKDSIFWICFIKWFQVIVHRQSTMRHFTASIFTVST